MTKIVSYANEKEIYEHTHHILQSVAALLASNLISRGVYREVYGITHTPDKVIKIETGVTFCNVNEWETWQEVKEMEVSKWFAPCFDISRDGRTLVQARTKPIPDRQWNNLKEIPYFFSDVKQENFGIYKGRIVCHDYGWTRAPGIGFASKRMRKVR